MLLHVSKMVVSTSTGTIASPGLQATSRFYDDWPPLDHLEIVATWVFLDPGGALAPPMLWKTRVPTCILGKYLCKGFFSSSFSPFL